MPHSKRTVTLIKGDGIGPEIADAVVAVLDAAEAPITWELADAGLCAIQSAGVGLPPATLESIRRNKLALKGPTTTPVGGGHKSVNVSIRKALDLFANVRPCKTLPGVHTRFEAVDLIIVRENIEDTYGGIEHMLTPDVAQCLKLITRPGSIAVSRYAFAMAQREGRRRVTCVQKANIHKMTDGLFLDSFRQVAAEFPDIQSDDILIDNCCMQLVTNPQRYDVLVTPNLFGDILSDLCAGLVGGLGVAPGGNIGHDRAVFEAVHGSAPDIAGRGMANPTALLLSSVQMLRFMGHNHTADRVESAVRMALVDGIRTRDLGGSASTREFTRGVIAALPAPDRDLDKPDAHAAGATTAPNIVRPAATSRTVLPKPSAAGVTGETWTCKGIDIFVHHEGMPQAPKQIGPLKLTMIGNRGQKVWPDETLDISLVNCFRCRYQAERVITDDEVLAALKALSDAGLSWMHIEKLHFAGSEPRFTKSAGE